MVKVILCSDDFGLGPAVDAGILSLARLGRLNAVSCMVVGDTCQTNAPELLSATQEAPIPVQIGLHLTLTEYTPAGPMPGLAPKGALPEIGRLIKKAHRGGLDTREIGDEIDRQLALFQDIFGRVPDFIDGHQHAHILPVIRDALIPRAQAALPKGGWVRSCHLPLADILKLRRAWKRSLIISALSRRLKTQLQAHHIPCNEVFYGVNDFDRGEDFATLMQSWLSAIAQSDRRAVIMCHPGTARTADDMTHDPIADRRPDELAYLSSDQFAEDLQSRGLNLG